MNDMTLREMDWTPPWLDAASRNWRAWSATWQALGRPSFPLQGGPGSPEAAGDAEAEDGPTSIDRLFHAGLARLTAGLSPAALWLAYADWALHLGSSPGKCAQLGEKAARKAVRLATYAARLAADPACPSCIEPLRQDDRFRDEAWLEPPFNLIHQAFLLNQQWWHGATTGIGGVSRHHEQLVAFMARQLLDTVSPVNFVATNPEVLAATLREGGQNLLRGAANFWMD